MMNMKNVIHKNILYLVLFQRKQRLHFLVLFALLNLYIIKSYSHTKDQMSVLPRFRRVAELN